MSYYRGDYYRGDGNYYKGDPFLGALVAGVGGKLLKKAAGWVGRQTVGGLIGKGAGAATAAAAIPAVTRAVTRPREELVIRPGAALPGGEPLFDTFTTRKKYRRMNPLNPKALKRALRRAEGFEKFAKQTMSALTKPGSTRKFKKATRSR